MTEEQASKAIDYIRDNAPEFAKAKATRIYLENFLKSKKAILMADAASSTIGGKDMEAMAHPEYLALLDGLREAVEKEEALKHMLEGAKLRFEMWKIESYNTRSETRLMT